MAVTASEARKNLPRLIAKVNDDRTPIAITSRRGDAVLMSRADYDALKETAHLLRVPANAKRLIESLQQAQSSPRSSDAETTSALLLSVDSKRSRRSGSAGPNYRLASPSGDLDRGI